MTDQPYDPDIYDRAADWAARHVERAPRPDPDTPAWRRPRTPYVAPSAPQLLHAVPSGVCAGWAVQRVFYRVPLARRAETVETGRWWEAVIAADKIRRRRRLTDQHAPGPVILELWVLSAPGTETFELIARTTPYDPKLAAAYIAVMLADQLLSTGAAGKAKTLEDGTVITTGPCWACGTNFTFDPDTVPAIVIDPTTKEPVPKEGPRPSGAYNEPLCGSCCDYAEREAGRTLFRRATS